jgi:hypothetical protein
MFFAATRNPTLLFTMKDSTKGMAKEDDVYRLKDENLNLKKKMNEQEDQTKKYPCSVIIHGIDS